MSQAFDIVITSGGIGPTHDDVTLKAVAAALGQEVTVSREMMDHLQDVHAEKAASAVAVTDMDESMKRLALLPEHSTLLWVPVEGDEEDSTPAPSSSRRRRSSKEWPVLRCDNIFVLPGIPQFFANKMNLITKHFVKTANKAIETHRIVLDVEESKIVELLDGLVAQHPNVKFGSYPFVDHPEFKTIISVESRGYASNETFLLEEAVNGLLEALPANAILRVERERGGASNKDG